jgi:hypothetical protein
VFTETQNSCKQIVSEIVTKIGTRKDEIKVLEDEIKTLEETRKLNDSLHNKIEQFLKD